MATRSEFAASIKAKYPQYQAVDDSTLVEKMLEKYPQYREKVTDDPPEKVPSFPGREAQGAFGVGPDPVAPPDPDVSNIFANRRNYGAQADRAGQNPETGVSYAPPSGAGAAQGFMDLMDTPARGAAAALTDQKMSDPDAYVLKPAVEARKATPEPFANPYANQNFAGTDALTARLVSDPLSWLAGIGTMGRAGLATLEKVLPGITKAAEAAHGWSGRSAERLSGVPLETLKAYSDPAKRALMKQEFGQEAEIGKEFLEKFREPEQYLTEVPKLKEIAQDLPPVSTKSAVEKMEGALPKPVEGFAPNEVGAYTDVERAANAKAQSNIDFIRGGAKPEDLEASLSRAGARATDAEIEAAALGAQAGRDAKEAAQATRAQASTQSKAGKAAAGVGKAKREAEEAFYSWDRRDTKAAIPEAIKEARQAATKAREAATDARAKVAVGEISKADYAAAKSTAEAAEANLELLTVTQKIHSGAPLKAVASELAKQGKSVEQIRDLLTRARDRSSSIVQPKSDVSFNAYWDKRKRLDSDIDYGKASDNLVDRVNKAGRTEMMQVMEQVAENSNHPEFKELMKSYSRKAKLVDDLKAYIGQTKGANDRKIQQFFDHLFGKNSQHKQDIVAEMDKVMGTNTLERARAAQQAQQIGHDGTAAWFPMHNTGAMGAGQQWLGRIGFLWSSPKVAARRTLPAFEKVEKLARGMQGALPPKARKLVIAIEKAEDPAKAAPLVNQLVQVLEAEAKNVIPFRMKPAAEKEEESTPRYSRQ